MNPCHVEFRVTQNLTSFLPPFNKLPTTGNSKYLHSPAVVPLLYTDGSFNSPVDGSLPVIPLVRFPTFTPLTKTVALTPVEYPARETISVAFFGEAGASNAIVQFPSLDCAKHHSLVLDCQTTTTISKSLLEQQSQPSLPWCLCVCDYGFVRQLFGPWEETTTGL